MACLPTRLLWRRSLLALREECTPLLPVRVRLVKKPSDYFGYTALAKEGTHFNVNVYKRVRELNGRIRNATRTELIDALMHEWAHCMAWPGTPDTHTFEMHTAEWGVAYSRCYQTVIAD